VDAPLLGPGGAVAVFGPQKGLFGQAAAVRERQLETWADLVEATTSRQVRAQPGAGAAGGVGFAVMAALGARMTPGIDLVLELVGFGAALSSARLVVTGEGLLDSQTLMGKTVSGVARAARAADVAAVAVCGASRLTPTQAAELGLARIYPLSDLEPDVTQSMANAAPLLAETCRRLAQDWT
jgi:glycerate kinase